jgi:hypothetical protein
MPLLLFWFSLWGTPVRYENCYGFYFRTSKKRQQNYRKTYISSDGQDGKKARDHLGLPLSKTSNISLLKFTQFSLLVAQSLVSAPPQQPFPPHVSGFFLQGSWGDPSPIDISWGPER